MPWIPRRPRPRGKYSTLQSPAGFTLIELLLALVMFAAMAAVIFAAFAAVADGVEKGRQSADMYRIGRGVIQRLGQELSTAAKFQHIPPRVFLGVNAQENDLPRDRIAFVTIPYRRFSPTVPENEYCDVSYYIAENPRAEHARPGNTQAPSPRAESPPGLLALFRTEDCTLYKERQVVEVGGGVEAGRGLELTDMAIGLDIVYFDAKEEYDHWPPQDGDESGLLPCRARIALTLQNARQQIRVFFTTVSLVLRGPCNEDEAEQ